MTPSQSIGDRFVDYLGRVVLAGGSTLGGYYSVRGDQSALANVLVDGGVPHNPRDLSLTQISRTNGILQDVALGQPQYRAPYWVQQTRNALADRAAEITAITHSHNIPMP